MPGVARPIVAVLDGPIQRNHPLLREARIDQDRDPEVRAVGDAVRHGTAVASLIFGHYPQPEALGLARGCHGVSLPIFFDDGPTGTFFTSPVQLAGTIQDAIDRGAQIINISAGHVIGQGAPAHPALLEAIRICAGSNVLVVAAAGDGGCRSPQIPAGLDGVIAVSSVTDHAAAVDGSPPTVQRGLCIAAPGTNVAAWAGGQCEKVSGTSYACALVTGAAGLIALDLTERGRGFDAEEVKRILLSVSPDQGHGPVIDIAALRRRYPTTPPGRPSSPVVEQRWQLDDSSTQVLAKFKGLTAPHFGSVTVQFPDREVLIQDLHYPTGGGTRSMVLVPASDGADGYTSLDHRLRAAMGLAQSDEIYGILSYIHPEEHRVKIADLPHRSKLYLGHRHIGAYLGAGRTSHALAERSQWRGSGPSQMELNLDEHPATVQVFELEGCPTAVLNHNARMVDAVIAARARVPRGADTINCRTFELRSILMYYRDLILGAAYLDDLDWFTNCSVHKLIVLNVAMNVPHNPDAFRAIFGDDGPRLWRAFRDAYASEFDRAWTDDCETDFVPLWRLSSLSAEEIRPLTEAEYHRFYAAMRERRLDDFAGPRPLEPGRGMVWPPETLADALGPVVDMYCPTERVGVVAGLGCWLLLRHVLAERIGLAQSRFEDAAVPIVARRLALHAARLLQGDPTAAIDDLAAQLQQWLVDVDKRAAPGDASRAAGRIAQLARNLVETADSPSPDDARGEVANLRYVSFPGDERNGLFASPGVFHKLALGLHPSNPFVRVRAICTAINHAHVRPVPLSQDQPGIPSPPRGVAMTNPDVVDPGGTEAAGGAVVAAEPGPAWPSVTPSTDGTRPADSPGQTPRQLVYALGTIGYDFPSAGRKLSVQQRIPAGTAPEDPAALLDHLDQSPSDAAALQWTFNIDNMPIYALQPDGPFAGEAYAILRQFLREQIDEGVERISLAGVITGSTRQRSGAQIPVINPEIRGMYSWTTAALVESLRPAAADDQSDEAVRDGVANFLDRVYYEIRNMGQEPWERALNFAATNAFEAEKIFESAIAEDMELDSIGVEPSPLAPAGGSYWDVKLLFFFPRRANDSTRRSYRFTVAVDDVVPATVGPMRAWYTR
jgi:hypothetical protein